MKSDNICQCRECVERRLFEEQKYRWENKLMSKTYLNNFQQALGIKTNFNGFVNRFIKENYG